MRAKSFALALFGAAGLSAASVASAGSQSLDLPGAVAYALAHSTALAASRANVANLEAAFAKQHAAEFPPVLASASNQLARSQNAQGNFAQFGISPQSNFSQNTAQIGSTYTLYNGSLNQILAQEDARQVQAARSNLKRSEQQTAVDVTASYHLLATRSEAVRLAESDVQYQQSLVAVARVQERVGRIAGVDVLRAQVAAARSESSLLTARADAANAKENLAQLIGAPLATDFVVPARLGRPPLPPGSVETFVEIAAQHRPDILAARSNLQLAQLERGAIDSDLRPQITLNGSFGNQTSPTSFVQTQQQIDAQNARTRAQNVINASLGLPLLPCCLPPVVRGTPGFWQIGAQTSLSFPLIDYGTRRAQHRAADQQIESARTALAAAETVVEADVRQSYRGAETALATLSYSAKASELAIESARIAQLQYRNGLISLTDVLATQQTALSAQLDYFTAQAAYLNALVKLRMALGIFDPISAVADLSTP